MYILLVPAYNYPREVLPGKYYYDTLERTERTWLLFWTASTWLEIIPLPLAGSKAITGYLDDFQPFPFHDAYELITYIKFCGTSKSTLYLVENEAFTPDSYRCFYSSRLLAELVNTGKRKVEKIDDTADYRYLVHPTDFDDFLTPCRNRHFEQLFPIRITTARP